MKEQEPLTVDEFAWMCGRSDGLVGTARKRSAEGELQDIGRMMRRLLREVARLRPDLSFDWPGKHAKEHSDGA